MKSTINLLPKKDPQEEYRKQRKMFMYFATGGLFALLFFAWGVAFSILQFRINLRDRLLSDITQKEQSIKSYEPVEILYKDVYNKATAAILLFKTRDLFLKNMSNVKGLVNKDVDITNITLDKNKVKATVVATDIASISQFMNTLEDQNRGLAIFSTLNLVNIAINKTTGYEIKIEGELAL